MVDITKVVITESEAVITGVDLDSIWSIKDEPDEGTECNSVSYKFDVATVYTTWNFPVCATIQINFKIISSLFTSDVFFKIIIWEHF